MEYKNYACLTGLAIALLIMPGCEWQTCRKEERTTIKKIAEEKDAGKNESTSEQFEAGEKFEEKTPAKKSAKKSTRNHNGVIEIQGKQEFDEILAEGKPVIADFYLSYCPPCKTMKPFFDEASHRHKDINFVAIMGDGSVNNALFDEYGVTACPRFIYIEGSGKVIEKHGPLSKEEFDNKVAAFAKKRA